MTTLRKEFESPTQSDQNPKQTVEGPEIEGSSSQMPQVCSMDTSLPYAISYLFIHFYHNIDNNTQLPFKVE